jgi:outer membrane protein assembly factor BamE (lipoprotein component of BamABCDE complex)
MEVALTQQFLAAIACAMVASAASAADLPTDKLSAFKPGVTTKAQVIASLGKPLAVNQNPDGRSTAVYDYNLLVSKEDRTAYERAVVFLFDPQNVMVDTKLYAKKPPGADAAVAQPPASAGAAAPLAGLSDENVLTPLAAGFGEGKRARQGPMDIIEFVPIGETVQDWSRMITLQVFHNLRGVDPDGLPGNIAKSWAQACPGGVGESTGRTTENGYPVANWAFRCPLNPQTGKPETMWTKVISGQDALYSVQYAYRRPMADDLPGPAIGYLKSVTVCDTRGSAHPCPSLKPVGP